MADSAFALAGAQVSATSAAPLHTDEFFTGMWTQSNPLGPGAVSHLMKRYAPRYDQLIGGVNIEITTRLTPARRPGQIVYNSSLFPPINRFYGFRGFSSQGESIRIMASVDPATGSNQGTVRDVTGPSTNLILWTKDKNAGRTSFVSVGNFLYFGDGVNCKMLVQSKASWTPNTQYQPGDFFVDPNGNIQEAVGAQTATITNIQVVAYTVGGAPGRRVTLFLSPSTPLNISTGTGVQLSGLTTIPALNSPTYPQAEVESSIQLFLNYADPSLPITPYTVETGTVSTGTGISGSTPPVWQTGLGFPTFDGGLEWINKGPAVQDMGFPGPATAPTVAQVQAPSIYPNWAADTWYSPFFVILDGAGNLEQLTTDGTTGTSAPSFSATIGAVTNDGTAKWTNVGPSGWQANHAYAANSALLITYTYYITQTVTKKYYDPDTNSFVIGPVETSVAMQATNLFQALNAGTSGANQPSWSAGLGTTAMDNGISWKNLGYAPTWSVIGASQKVTTANQVIDTNGYLELIQKIGKSGSAGPSWQGQSATTVDNTANWTNIGPISPAGTKPWIYAYSGKSSITGQVGTASPLSLPFTATTGNLPVIQGSGLPNPPEDRIILWRTLAGGSLLFQLDEIPNPGAAQTWIYTDTTPDYPAAGSTGLNTLINAPIAGQNNPPPSSFVPQCYYLTRIWGWDGNELRYSAGPDQLGTAGSGDQSFPSQNKFTFPSLGVKCWATSIGLICYTNSDIWAVLGQGTATSPFYVVSFQEGVGLANQDALCVNGSTSYGMLTSSQVVSMDPGAGEVEVGFPIGDLFTALYTPSQTYCTWHQQSSADMGLYVADGATGWFRMAAVAAPESGNVWSPQAIIEGGVKAIASLEIAPGTKALLLGPSQQNQPILMRSGTTNQDNGQPYIAYFDLAAVVMAQPGSTVGVQFIVTEEKMIAGASALTVGVLFDEIYGAPISLRNACPDPPNLPRSKTVRATRHWIAQDANTVEVCRYMQQRISWPAENFPNELYTNTIYGRVPEKARK